MNIFKKINIIFADSFYKVFSKDVLLLFFYTIVMFFPMLRRNAYEVTLWLFNTLPFCFALCFLICFLGQIILHFFSEKYQRFAYIVWHVIFSVIVYVISIIDYFLSTTFGLKLNNTAIQLAFQTNAAETNEFLSTYVFSTRAFVCLALFGILFVSELLIVNFLKRFNPMRSLLVKIVVAIYLLIGFAGIGVFFYGYSAPTAIEMESRILRNIPSIQEHNLVSSLIAMRSIYDNKDSADKLRKHISDTKISSQNSYSGNIVLIIGESHIKKHSSLYGYNKQTNPLLETTKNNLCIFDDAITVINSTNTVLKYILSVSSLDGDNDWDETTFFPAVFKASGWDVSFWSNQISSKPGHDSWNAAITSYLNDPVVSSACFSFRNSDTYQYDGIMVDSLLSSVSQQMVDNRPKLQIVHFWGQHVAYKQRFPSSRQFFTTGDYKERTDLADSEKQLIADYDNATRYNDEQIFRIVEKYKDEDAVIIYLSDHGEEVFDYRKHFGRTHDLKPFAPNSYHYQIDIPFVVYMSNKYLFNHPEKAELIGNSTSRPFMIDDICHLLFYLGDIDTEWFDPKRCLIHPDYNIDRQRVLENGDNYEVLSK